MLPTIEQWRRGGSMQTLEGRRIFVRREGRGSPLLTIHGYPTASWDWAKIWPDLTARHEVFALDMLGFGFSEKPEGHRYRIAEQADFHVALLEQSGVSTFDVLCHDYGVTVGQELLARHGEGRLPGLRSIVFLNGGLFPETHRARLIQRVLASPVGTLVARLASERTFAKSMQSVFGPNTQPTSEELRGFYELASRDGGNVTLARLIAYIEERRQMRARWVGAFVDARVPLRLINGVHDPVSGAHMVARALELRPGTDVVRLDVGHYPQVEDPDGVLAAFHAFIDGVPDGR